MISPLPAIAKATELIRDGGLEPIELVEHCLARIHRFDQRVRAWVLVDEEGARREARRLRNMALAGKYLGPLHGIPVGVKDIIDVEGMPTRAGSPLREDRAAAADAPVVAMLRRVGAIILGKTVTTEYAGFDPSPTRNPWNPDHTPGGSSSGSAAAVALEMCLVALGSQTGGSVIRPAAYCGVAGFKPKFDAYPRDGVVPMGFHLDTLGLFARTASDLAQAHFGLLRIDPQQLVHDIERLTTAFLHRLRSSAPILGVIEDSFAERADVEVRAITSAALEKLQEAGARLESFQLPFSFSDVHVMHRRVMAVEAATVHREQYAKHAAEYGRKMAALIEEGLAIDASDYADALRHQEQFKEDMMGLLGGVDACIMPATPTTAPASLETTGDPSFNSPWTYAHLPTACVPCGLDSRGMPSGLQLLGASDVAALEVAKWCERSLGFDAQPDLVQASE